MIKTIITPGSNTGEIAILLEAQKRSVTTGGFVKELRQPSLGTRTLDGKDKGQAKCDLENLRVADLTVLFVVDDSRPASRNRMERIWNNRRRRSVIRVSAVGEQIPVVRECRLLGVEVLNFICIQRRPDCPAATRMLTAFLTDFLEEASQIVEQAAAVSWDAQARVEEPLQGRTLFPGPIANFNRTNDRRFLPGVAQLAREMIFQSVIEAPIDPVLKRRIIDEAIDNVETDLGKIASGNRVDGWFEKLWQPCFIKAVREHITLKPFPPDKPEFDFKTLLRQFAPQRKQLALRFGRVESNPQSEMEFQQICKIAADTRLREDRCLRTLVLLFLGAIYQSEVASEIVGRCMTAHEKINQDFSQGELHQRFQAVGGWDAVIESCKANRYVHQQDPFLEIASTMDKEQLEAELFYKADEFRRCQELWDANWVAAFCHSLCFLCGEDEALWRSWIGPPKR